MIVDTHTHLGDPAFDRDRAEVLDRAREAGVLAVVSVSERRSEVERNLELAAEFPMLRVAAGLFPTVLDEGEGREVEELIRRHREQLVAVGEVGLDYWKVQDEADREVQRGIFRRFIDLAVELDLPLNVHSRSAGRATIEVLVDRGARRVQLHAFDGRAAKARPGVEAGFFFSVPPSIVRSRQKQKLVRSLPVECLLLETDSPVLGVDPEERNEPANCRLALDELARLRGVEAAQLEETILDNTRRLYGDAIC